LLAQFVKFETEQQWPKLKTFVEACSEVTKECEPMPTMPEVDMEQGSYVSIDQLTKMLDERDAAGGKRRPRGGDHKKGSEPRSPDRLDSIDADTKSKSRKSKALPPGDKSVSK